MITLTLLVPDCLGCCAVCHDAWGDTLDAVLSGFVDCDCFISVDFKGLEIVGFTGITGSYTATWTGSVWEVVIGTIDLQYYTDFPCATPDGAPITYDVKLQIGCLNNLLTVQVLIVGATVNVPALLFNQLGNLDDVMTNGLTCDGNIGGLVSTATISLP